MTRGLVTPARRPLGWVAPGPAPAGPRDREDLWPAEDEDLCFLSGDWRLFQKRRGHRWSLDDLVTAAVAAEHAHSLGAERMLDLGCGLGSVLLLMAWRFAQARVNGIEAQPDRAEMARRSIAYNGVENRCQVITGDLRNATSLPGGPFQLITGTPPYFPRGTGVESTKHHAMPCRFELRGGVEAYLETGLRMLDDGGRIVLCSAALEADRVAAAALAQRAHVIDHLEVIPREGKAALVMVDVFAREPVGRVERRLTVRSATHQWTDEFRAVRTAFGMPCQH